MTYNNLSVTPDVSSAPISLSFALFIIPLLHFLLLRNLHTPVDRLVRRELNHAYSLLSIFSRRQQIIGRREESTYTLRILCGKIPLQSLCADSSRSLALGTTLNTKREDTTGFAQKRGSETAHALPWCARLRSSRPDDRQHELVAALGQEPNEAPIPHNIAMLSLLWPTTARALALLIAIAGAHRFNLLWILIPFMRLTPRRELPEDVQCVDRLIESTREAAEDD